MNTTHPKLSLKQGLTIWKDQKNISAIDKNHLSSIELLRCCAPGGMAEAQQERKAHLSTCSICLQKWLDMTEEQSFVDEIIEPKGSDDWYSGGMTEAAAADVTATISLKSRCGQFQLTLFPDDSKADEGMIALDYTGNAPEIEGKRITVKDMNGLLLLEGSLRAGRIATISKHFKSMNLQAWSIHIHAAKKENGDS